MATDTPTEPSDDRPLTVRSALRGALSALRTLGRKLVPTDPLLRKLDESQPDDAGKSGGTDRYAPCCLSGGDGTAGTYYGGQEGLERMRRD